MPPKRKHKAGFDARQSLKKRQLKYQDKNNLLRKAHAEKIRKLRAASALVPHRITPQQAQYFLSRLDPRPGNTAAHIKSALQGLKCVVDQLTEDERVFDRLCSTGVVGKLVPLVSPAFDAQADVQEAALDLITSVCCSSTGCGHVAREPGIVPHVARLLGRTDTPVKVLQSAFFVMHNIVVDCHEYRCMFLENNLLYVVQKHEKHPEACIRECFWELVWMLTNFLRLRDNPRRKEDQGVPAKYAEALSVTLRRALPTSNVCVLQALDNLAQNQSYLDLLMRANVLEPVMPFCVPAPQVNSTTSMTVLSLVSHFTYGERRHMHYLVSLGILPVLSLVLNHAQASPNMIQHSCFMLTNVFMDLEQLPQIGQQLVQGPAAGLIPALHQLSQPQNPRFHTEACVALCSFVKQVPTWTELRPCLEHRALEVVLGVIVNGTLEQTRLMQAINTGSSTKHIPLNGTERYAILIALRALGNILRVVPAPQWNPAQKDRVRNVLQQVAQLSHTLMHWCADEAQRCLRTYFTLPHQ